MMFLYSVNNFGDSLKRFIMFSVRVWVMRKFDENSRWSVFHGNFAIDLLFRNFKRSNDFGSVFLNSLLLIQNRLQIPNVAGFRSSHFDHSTFKYCLRLQRLFCYCALVQRVLLFGYFPVLSSTISQKKSVPLNNDIRTSSLSLVNIEISCLSGARCSVTALLYSVLSALWLVTFVRYRFWSRLWHYLGVSRFCHHLQMLTVVEARFRSFSFVAKSSLINDRCAPLPRSCYEKLTKSCAVFRSTLERVSVDCVNSRIALLTTSSWASFTSFTKACVVLFVLLLWLLRGWLVEHVFVELFSVFSLNCLSCERWLPRTYQRFTMLIRASVAVPFVQCIGECISWH